MPKHHMILHLCEEQVSRFGNPSVWWNYRDEHEIGVAWCACVVIWTLFPTPRNCWTLFQTLFWTLFNDLSKSYTRLEWPITIPMVYTAAAQKLEGCL